MITYEISQNSLLKTARQSSNFIKVDDLYINLNEYSPLVRY